MIISSCEVDSRWRWALRAKAFQALPQELSLPSSYCGFHTYSYISRKMKDLPNSNLEASIATFEQLQAFPVATGRSGAFLSGLPR
eukprot:4693710-Pleurochrysis_carterae.AAC.1